MAAHPATIISRVWHGKGATITFLSLMEPWDLPKMWVSAPSADGAESNRHKPLRVIPHKRYDQSKPLIILFSRTYQEEIRTSP